jgi:endonuclease/exonuclease/phosphatase (EEP) superfamily protein YafD
LLNTLAFYLFVPIVVFLPLCLWSRQRRLLLGLLFACLLFLSLFHPLFNPFAKAALPAPAQPTLKVMSFNLRWDNRNYGKVAQMIRTAQPDLIGLQELQPGEVSNLAAALAPDYPYRAVHPVDLFHTVALFSRLPIDSMTALPNPPLERGLQVTIRDKNDRPLNVLVTHLAPNNMPLFPLSRFAAETRDRYSRRAAETASLQTLVRSQSLPTLMLCDCNMTDTSETYAQLRQVFKDSFQERGWGLGHTISVKGIPFPVQRIDYIWYTDEIQAIDAFVGPDANSDHLPIVATLRYH